MSYSYCRCTACYHPIRPGDTLEVIKSRQGMRDEFDYPDMCDEFDGIQDDYDLEVDEDDDYDIKEDE